MLCVKKPADPTTEGEGGAVDIDTILAAGIMRGLRMQDAEQMTLGMWVDYIIEWNNLNRPRDKKDDVKRRARQADFDAF